MLTLRAIESSARQGNLSLSLTLFLRVWTTCRDQIAVKLFVTKPPIVLFAELFLFSDLRSKRTYRRTQRPPTDDKCRYHSWKFSSSFSLLSALPPAPDKGRRRHFSSSAEVSRYHSSVAATASITPMDATRTSAAGWGSGKPPKECVSRRHSIVLKQCYRRMKSEWKCIAMQSGNLPGERKWKPGEANGEEWSHLTLSFKLSALQL